MNSFEFVDYRLTLPGSWELQPAGAEDDAKLWYLDAVDSDSPNTVGVLVVRSQERQSDPDRSVQLGIEIADSRGDLVEGHLLVDGESEHFQTFVSKNIADADSHVLSGTTYNDDFVVTFEFYAPAVVFENLRAEMEPYFYALDILNTSSS